MKDYTNSSPVFSESIRITEPSDPAHADNVNAAPKQLLQNSLANREEICKLQAKLDSLLALVCGYSYNRNEKKIISLCPHDYVDGKLTFPEGAASLDGSKIVLQGTAAENWPPVPDTGIGTPDIGTGTEGTGSLEEIAAAAAKIVEGNMVEIEAERVKDMFRNEKA